MNVHYFKELWKSSLMVLMLCFGMSSWGQTTITHTFNSASSLSGSVDDNIDIEVVKHSANAPAYNNGSGGHLRMYSDRATGDGNELILTTNDNVIITDVSIARASSSGNPSSVTYFVDGGTPIEFPDSVSGISASSSFSIKNQHFGGGSNLQLHISSITITYTTATSCETPTYSFAESTVNKITNDESFTNAFSSDNTSTMVWSSTDNGVATVDTNGEVTLVGAGITEITVNQEADETYCAVQASYTLNVAAISYAITATSNNTDFGSVILSGNVITATPAVGYTYASPAYTVTIGAATVVQNDNEFTVTPSEDSTIQINFEAMPTYTLSLMNDGSAYTDENLPLTTYAGNSIELPTLTGCSDYVFAGWDTNSATTSAPTYAGGDIYNTTTANVTLYAVYSITTEGGGTTTSNFGFEDGDTGWTSDATKLNTNPKTGTYSGRINTSNVHVTFDNIVASPESITFSLMRTSNNTNHNIKVQVSSDNSTWSDVATYLMSEFNNGSYTEKTTDLSTYENVYVRVYYSGTTAVRHIDDISLVYGGGSTTTYTSTPGCDAPQLIVSETELSDFNYTEGNGPSAAQSFTVSGANLDGSDVSVTAPANFEVSTSEASGYASTVTLAAYDGAEQTIWVRLAEEQPVNTYTGSVIISGGGATDATVAVSGAVLAVPAVTAETFNGTVGVAFSAQITATENPTSYAITGTLPTGLDFDITTGAITGTPEVAGSFDIEVTATNIAGASAAATITLEIAKGTQTIADFADMNAVLGADAITLPETTNAGLVISYSSSETDVATVSGNTVTIIGLGTATITATQAGDANWNELTETITLTVTEAPIIPEAGMLFITEVAEGASTSTEYLEIYNNTESAIDLTGSKIKSVTDNTTWTFGGSSGTTTGTAIIPARGFVIITRGGALTAFESAFGTLNENTVFIQGSSQMFFAASSARRWQLLDFEDNVIDDTEDVAGGDGKSTYQNIFAGTFTTINNANSQTPGALEYLVYTAGAWTNAVAADDTTITSDVLIYGDYTLAGDVSVKTLSVASGGKITVPANTVLTVDGKITNNGEFTVENDGILIQNNAVANTGAITVKRNSNPMFRLDYTLWSSPVAMNLVDFSDVSATSPTAGNGTLWNRVYTLGALAWNQVWTTQPDLENDTTPFVAGQGYLYRSPNSWVTRDSGNPAEVYEGIFDGVPNNGDVTATTPYEFSSIGNPYPSPIDADILLYENTDIDFIYFWTNTHPPVGGSYDEQPNNWAYYNLAGGTGTDGGEDPDGTIQTGQGFVAKMMNAAAGVNFNNGQRINTNGAFFRAMATERSRFWLNLSNEEVTFNQILVGYMDNATQGVDTGIDAKMFGYEGNALYSIIDNSEDMFVIQGRSLPFEASDVVALGFRAVNAGSFTISLHNFDGLFTEGNTTIYLKDNYTQTQHNLMSGAYSFISDEGMFDNRFEVVYQTTMSVENPVANNSNWIVYNQGEGYQIQTQGFELQNVTVFDLLGRTIYTAKAEGTGHNIPALGADSVYIVKVTSTENVVLSKKVK